MDSIGGKMCRSCGEDCTDRPRVKDGAGRYYCRECYDRLAQQQQEAKSGGAVGVREVGDDPSEDILSELISAGAVSSRVAHSETPCPQCSAKMKADAALCTTCGYDRISNANLKTSVHRAGPDRLGSKGVLWPILIGLISIALGALGLLDSVSGMISDGPGRGMIATLFTIALSCWVGYAGIGVILHRSGAVASLRGWAFVILGLCVLASTCVGLGLAIGGPDMEARMLAVVDDPKITTGQDIRAAFLLQVALIAAWPVFVLIWFHRATVRNQVADW